MAPFSEHVDNFRPNIPKMDDIFSGKHLGPKHQKNRISDHHLTCILTDFAQKHIVALFFTEILPLKQKIQKNGQPV